MIEGVLVASAAATWAMVGVIWMVQLLQYPALARASALLDGRDFVGPDDVRTMAIPALGHRVVLSDDAWARRVDPEGVVQRAVDRVDVPQAG